LADDGKERMKVNEREEEGESEIRGENEREKERKRKTAVLLRQYFTNFRLLPGKIK